MNNKTFTIDMLQADDGDALWIRFGERGSEKNILVDGGYQTSMRELIRKKVFCPATPDKPFKIDLLVVTHIDGDHIGGAIALLTYAADCNIKIDNIWFNGYHQVFQTAASTDDTLGYRDGEKLSALIRFRTIPLNKNPLPPYENLTASGRIAVEGQVLPCVDVDDLRLTVLGPPSSRLDDLRTAWDLAMKGNPGNIYEKQLADLRRAADVLGDCSTPGSDDAVANGSSISLLMEYGGVTVLLAADAFPDDLTEALDALPAAMPRPIDVFKLPHHGSVANINQALIERVGASHYLISTSGNRHDHPDTTTIDMILRARAGQTCEIHFNYVQARDRIRQHLNGRAVGLGNVPDDKGNHLDLMALCGPV